MSSLAIRQQAVQSERRQSGRLPIDITVELRLVSGTHTCRMGNVSDSGAMLEMEHPPRTGVSGWLVMGEDEVYCTVAWSNVTSCGIEFERSLPSAALGKFVGEPEQNLGPIINRSNIPMGRKRSRLVSGER